MKLALVISLVFVASITHSQFTFPHYDYRPYGGYFRPQHDRPYAYYYPRYPVNQQHYDYVRVAQVIGSQVHCSFILGRINGPAHDVSVVLLNMNE